MRTRLLCLCLTLTACDKPSDVASDTPAPAAEQPSAQGLPDRDPALAHRLVTQEGALLLDVRTKEEYDEGHLEGAVLIPHDELAGRIDEVLEKLGGDKSKPIVVYCRSGGRAGKAKTTLQENGFDQVTNLGGMTDWCDDCSTAPGE